MGFSFEVFWGVKTGCPWGSIFLVCVNHFVDLVLRLSDEPKFSVTRICADDFGSALRSLSVFKSEASIFLWLPSVQDCIQNLQNVC